MLLFFKYRVFIILSLILAIILAFWFYTDHIEKKTENRVFLEIEQQIQVQQERFRQSAESINREIQNLDADQLRDRALVWMR
jgi:predicted membrane protein